MNDTQKYYKNLKKPFFSPPSWIFGPVWTLLYIIIFSSFWYGFYLYFNGEIPSYIAILFLLNLIFNFCFTPLQFRLRNNFLALIDIILVLVTLLLLIIFIFPYNSVISYFQIPYLIWVIFATILQISITYLNRKKW